VEKRYGARLLEPLLWIPGAKLVHGLPWPGSPGQLADHALVCGRRVALIATVMWPAGRYTLDKYWALLRDGRPFGSGRLCFDDAVRTWAEILPNTHVEGFIVVHASTPGRLELAIDGQISLVCVGATRAHEVIGAWLVAEAGLVDRNVLAKLLTPPPPRWPYDVWAHV